MRGIVEIFELDVRQRHGVSAPHRAGVTECLVVTSGTVRTGPTGDSVELAAGDSARFDASVSHGYQAVDGPGRAVLVMTYQS